MHRREDSLDEMVLIGSEMCLLWFLMVSHNDHNVMPGRRNPNDDKHEEP